jgi:dTMP kinase
MKDSGAFIVFDGTEGCGKSTQARLLEKRLLAQPELSRGAEVILVRDPGTTVIGEQIRSILLDPNHAEMGMRCEMLLYMSARAQMMSQMILPALSRAGIVICDRFVSSTLAYQLGGDGLSAKQIREVAEIAIKGRWPDMTLILDIPAEQSLARVKRPRDRIEQRPLSYHEQVRENYLAQAALEPKRYRVVDAAREPEQVHEDVWRELERVLKMTSGE